MERMMPMVTQVLTRLASLLCTAAFLLAANAHAGASDTERLEIFDAHLHYNDEACAFPGPCPYPVADVLAKKRFKKVPVIDEDGRLIGMVRRATITRYLFDVLFGEEEPSAE